jgi:beta-phosphoglucomutase-like phosphatase (HAD superfamily)
MEVKAIIFDCDGVLVDSEPYSCAVWKPVLAKRGVTIEDDFKLIVGKNSSDAIKFFFDKYSFTGNIDEIAKKKKKSIINLQKAS